MSRLQLGCLVLIIAAGGYLRLAAANHPYISQWDEAYHALVARNLARHPAVPTLYDAAPLPVSDQNWKAAHVWLHKPPLMLWCMALCIRLGGEDELVFRIPSLLLSTGSILLTFLLGRWLAGTACGLLASLFLAVNPLAIRLCSGTVPTDHIDVAAMFWVQLTFWVLARAAGLGSRRLLILGAGLLGLGLMVKSLPCLLGGVAITPMLYGWLAACPANRAGQAEPRRLGLCLALSALLLLVAAGSWPLYTAMRWPVVASAEAHSTWQHLLVALEGHARPLYWYLWLLPSHFGGLSLWRPLRLAAYGVMSLLLVWSGWRACKRRDPLLLSMMLWVLIPYCVFSLARTKMYAYVGIATPALLLLLAYALVDWLRYWWPLLRRCRERARRSLLLLPLALVALWLVSTLGERATADYSICPWNGLYDYTVFRRTMLRLRVQSEQGQRLILFNVGDDKEIQAMYYTDAPAYASVPDPDSVRRLQQDGYRVCLLLDDRRRNEEALRRLARNGLLGREMLLPIASPSRQPSRHPYDN